MMQKVKNEPALLPTLAGYDTFRIGRKQDTTLKISGYEMPVGENPFIEKVLKKLKPGELWDNIVEDDYSYKIVRFLGENDTNYIWDGVVIPKRNFDDWFRDYATKHIKIEIYDAAIKEAFLKKYPNLWWRNLFVN